MDGVCVLCYLFLRVSNALITCQSRTPLVVALTCTRGTPPIQSLSMAEATITSITYAQPLRLSLTGTSLTSMTNPSHQRLYYRD